MRRWSAFVLLCAVQAFAWLALEHSRTGITAATCAAGAALAAVCVMWLPKSRSVSVLGTCCVLIGPWLCLLLGDRSPGSGAVAMALALVPVVVAVAEPALGGTDFSPAKLWPGLAAAAALLVIEPPPSLADWRVDVMLGLVPLVTGIGCVLLRRSGGRQSSRPAALGVAAGIFLLLAIAQFAMWHIPLVAFATNMISVVPVLFCALIFVLELLVLQQLSAATYSGQYAIVPLLALLQAPFVISAGVFSWRFGMSVLLLAAASVALLRENSEEKLA